MILILSHLSNSKNYNKSAGNLQKRNLSHDLNGKDCNLQGKKISKSNLKQTNLYLIWLEILVCITKTGSFQRNLMNKNYLQIWFHSTTFISETTKN